MSNDEYELNFLKINSNNNAKLIGVEDYELEILDLMACVSPFESETIDGILIKFFKKFIPSVQDLIKTNIELSKQFLKVAHSDKKGFNISESINRILSTYFKEKFIFNKINIQDVCNILAFSFNDIKKFKISSYPEFQTVLKKINFNKYKIDKLYLNTDYLKSRNNSYSRLSSLRTISTITSSASIIKENDESSEIDDINPKFINKYHNKAIGVIYIDNNIKNIINSSYLNSDYNYNEEEVCKKILTKECFSYQKNNKDEGELPLELIILLYKLKDVNTLIYQINNVDEQFLKMASFIFLNIKWLFMHEIEEIKYDLGNNILQKGINDVFNERTLEIYNSSQIIKNSVYYNGSYKARTINCWEPECDIFFDKTILNNEKSNDYIYSDQSNIEECHYDNHLCNIYNEFGNLTNLKYIRPVIYTYKNNDNQIEQKLEECDDIDSYINTENALRSERESIYSINSLNSKSSASNQSANQNNLSTATTIVERNTPLLLKDFVKKHIFYFQMITLYSYFFIKEFKKLKKLGIYFHKSYSFEIQLMFKLFDISYDRFHFLNFINNIDTLTEADFSFNSLDSKSFENILGIINKNANLISLKMSFFTPDINYFINSLLNIWSSKKLSIRKLFSEQKEYLLNNTGDKERDLNYFIINHSKFLEAFSKNLRNFFNLLKVKTLNNLEELVLRFDIPLQILNSEKYIILLVKFIINILIMLTFQDNRIHTLKLLAPELPFNSIKIPYIRQLFKEILLERENMDERLEEKIKSEKKRKEKIRIKEKERELKEQREKEIELREKNARKDLLENISNNFNIASSFSTKDVIKVMENKENEENIYVDIDNNLEQYDYSKRFRSVFHKKKNIIIEKEPTRKETMSSDKYLIEQRRQLNENDSLENIIIQFKIYNLPEIFNIFIMNNLRGLKSINLGYLDEITFISFIKDYKINALQLQNLTSLKISLCPSVVSFNNLEKNIYDYINTNTPNLEEKFLFSDLKIVSEAKMNEFVDLVYFKALVPKIVVQIGNDNDNIHLLSKVVDKYNKLIQTQIYSLVMLMDLPEYKKLYTMNIIRCLASFYSKKENSAILCKENLNN